MARLVYEISVLLADGVIRDATWLRTTATTADRLAMRNSTDWYDQMVIERYERDKVMKRG